MSRLILALSTAAASAVVLTAVALILGKAAPIVSKPPAPHVPPRPELVQQPAAPGTAAPARAPASELGSGIFKCSVAGKTVYSDVPCPGAVEVDTRAAATTFQTPRYVPSSGEAHIEPAPVAQSAVAPRDRECESVRDEIDRLDSMARAGGTAAYMDWIRAQRRRAEDRRYELRC
jgi:hypothetical protein